MYLSLGDSIAGDKDTFVDEVGETLREGLGMRTVNLAQGGSTIVEVFTDQLADAVNWIVEEGADLITVVVGANDMNDIVNSAFDDTSEESTLDIVQRKFAVLIKRYDGLLSILRNVAGEDDETRLGIMTYYNPYPPSDGMHDFVEVMLNGPDGLNTSIKDLAEKYDAIVLALGDVLDHTLVRGEETIVSPTGEEITLYDVHPNAEGHKQIAKLVIDELIQPQYGDIAA